MQLKDEDYENLLVKYNELFNARKEAIDEGIHDYSLMNSLLKKTDEVNLHSNFIYSMINPKGSHYCRSIFLELFLEAINEEDFIDIKNANVYKEKGKIDLLIEDGNHFLIIENKLRAKDQDYQISRYIENVYSKYMDKDASVDDKIRVIYLSEYKAKPSVGSKSIIGFELESKMLKWKGIEEKIKDTQFKEKINSKLLPNTQIKFNRVQHSKELLKWVERSKSLLATRNLNSSSLVYAFDEYQLILKRLDTKKQWRNIMSLDQYAFNMGNEEEQKNMYAFMCEANEKLNDYLYEKLFEDIVELFPERGKLVLNNKEFNEFTKDSCRKWFKQIGQSENYRDVGFVFNEKYFFALGKNNISYGLCDKGWKVKTNRINLQTNNAPNLFDVINALREVVDK